MGRKKVLEVLGTAALLASVGVMAALTAWETGRASIFLTFVYGWAAAVLFLLTLVCVDISRHSPSNSHTVKSLFLQYAYITLMYVYGSRFYQTLRTVSGNCTKYQENLLLAVIRKNEETVFGKANKFNMIRSRQDLRTFVKLHQYSDLVPYVEKVEKGEPNVLTVDQVLYLALSSGTTGKNKVIPVTSYMKGNAGIGMGASFVYLCHQTAGLNLKKEVNLLYMPKVTKMPCGLMKGPVSYHMMRYVPFCTAPESAYKISDETTALYVQAVFALAEREVGSMTSLMATLVFAFWKLVSGRWEEICNDIELGKLSDDLENLDPRVRFDLEENLQADPDRATELRKHFKEGIKGLAKKIWPDCKFARMLTTGSFYHYSKALEENELSGVPQISLVHAASEGFLGINMTPRHKKTFYMAHPMYGFLEFIPEEKCHEEQPATLFIDQLEIGKNYEMVITSPMGLFRYRVGDVVRIEAYQGQCPIYSYQYRIGQLLNLFWEKTPENVFYEAITATCENLGVKIADYTTTEAIHIQHIAALESNKKYYVLFLELQEEKQNSILAEDECLQFDKALCSRLELYNSLRQNNSISSMKTIQVSKGTFSKLKQDIIKETQNQQFKMPRVIKDESYISILFQAKVDKEVFE